MKSSLLALPLLLAFTCPLFAAAPKPLVPTHANVSYGPHKANVLDFWQAEGDGPRPLLVYIHGGGWIGGDKKQRAANVQPYLDKGISYAAINYRHTGKAPLPAPVHDAARAIQFIRSKAEAWNLKKIADRAHRRKRRGMHLDVDSLA